MLLWLEACGVVALAFRMGQWWLVPLAGVLVLLGALLTRGLVAALPAALILPAVWGLTWRRLTSAGVDLTAPPPAGLALFFLIGGTVCAFAAILAGLNRTPGETGRADRLGRLAVILHFLSGAVLLAGRHLELPAHLWLAWAASAMSLAMAADTVVRLMVRLYTPRRHWAALAAPGDFFFFRKSPPSADAGQKLAAPSAVDEHASLQLREMWMWPSIRRALPALVVVTAGLAWLATGVHEIPAGSQGVRQRFGAWEEQSLASGLHFSLPWPFGGIQQPDTSRVRETALGFRADPGRPILWERAHYEDEQKSLVGSGDDFLSVSVMIYHRISDPADWLKSSADPDQLLRSLADRVLLRLTLHRPAAELMTTAREPLRAEFKAQLQAELDARHSGQRVEEVLLRDVHPPVEVAPAYQEVVGALEEKEAFLHGGEEYRRDILTRTKGDAAEVTITARSNAENRLARVHGEVSRFASQEAAFQSAPDLYAVREGFRTLDASLAGAKKVIYDKALRGALPTHLDLRKVLNPDLVDTSPPPPQTLVPAPLKSRDAFDLDVEGLLRADRGAVPAVNPRDDDSDNLLNNAPAPAASSPAANSPTPPP